MAILPTTQPKIYTIPIIILNFISYCKSQQHNTISYIRIKIIRSANIELDDEKHRPKENERSIEDVNVKSIILLSKMILI